MSDDGTEIEIDEHDAVPEVAASEHDLIMMARALVGRSRSDDIWAMLCATRNPAPKIGPTCAELLEDTLRQTWRTLWLRGGAHPGASLAGGATVRGRLWERHQPVPLAFSPATLQFLRWLVATPFAAPASTLPDLPAARLSLGDQVLVYLALDAARATPALRVIANQPFVRESALAWLGFASALAGRGAKPPAFDSLVSGAGAIVVEALSGELGRRWYTCELTKRSVTDPAELIELGAVQDGALNGFMTACDVAKRRDLAGFVLDAAIPLLARNLSPAPLALDPKAPLSQRAQARTAAGSLLRAIVRWCDWDHQHRGVRFIDDDYAASQLLLERFEPVGAAGTARATTWLADLAALAPTTPPSSDATVAAGTT